MPDLQSAIFGQQSSQMGAFPADPTLKKGGAEEMAMALAGMASNPQIAPFLSLGAGTPATSTGTDTGFGTGGGFSPGSLVSPGIGGTGGALGGLQAALQGLSLGKSAVSAGSSIGSGLSGLYNALFGGGSLGPASPSIEAGLVEMLGPELAAQLGYTGAGATAIGGGLTVGGGEAAVGAMTGAGAGAELGAGAGAELGLGASAGALALPLLIGGLNMAFGPGKGGAFEAAYPTAASSIADKISSGYDAARLGREIGGATDAAGNFTQLPTMDIFAAVNQIIDRSGARASIGDVGTYNADMAPALSQIMVSQNRWPTADEVRNIYQQVTQAKQQAAEDEWRTRSYMGDLGGRG